MKVILLVVSLSIFALVCGCNSTTKNEATEISTQGEESASLKLEEITETEDISVNEDDDTNIKEEEIEDQEDKNQAEDLEVREAVESQDVSNNEQNNEEKDYSSVVDILSSRLKKIEIPNQEFMPKEIEINKDDGYRDDVLPYENKSTTPIRIIVDFENLDFKPLSGAVNHINVIISDPNGKDYSLYVYDECTYVIDFDSPAEGLYLVRLKGRVAEREQVFLTTIKPEDIE